MKKLLTLVHLCAAVAGMAAENVLPESRLEAMQALAKQEKMRVYGICEIIDGKSKTVRPVPASNCQNTYSIAKAFTVTAIGILEDRGLLSTDEKVYPIFEKDFPEGFDERWKKVTIHHLLKHQSGLSMDMLDIDNVDPCVAYGNDDFLNLTLGRKLGFEPGTKSDYSDVTFYILGHVIYRKTGIRPDDFIIREILTPLRFREFAFSKCPNGFALCGTGMYITTSDMAKLGQLFVQNGVYNGKQILSPRMVEKILKQGYEFHRSYGGGYAKGGMLGQLLWFNRETKRVIAIHSYKANIDKLMECGGK